MPKEFLDFAPLSALKIIGCERCAIVIPVPGGEFDALKACRGNAQ